MSLCALCACGEGGDMAMMFPSGTATLGMNDVSILVPLPTSPEAPVLLRAPDLMDDGRALVDRALWDRIIAGADGSPEVFADYRTLQIVAVRFDLCSRHDAGECPGEADGQLRLVLQPIDPGLGADDISVHALFELPHDELAGLVGELRGLAGMATGGRTAPLQPSPTLAASPSGAYADRLRVLLRGKATSDRLRRLTFLAQPSILSSVHWELRGLDRASASDAFTELDIPSIDKTRSGVTLVGVDSFELSPLVDDPPGLALAVDKDGFSAASEPTRRAALSALMITDNPMKRTADTVQCAACHVSTFAAAARAKEGGYSLADVAERYVSSYDLSIAAGQNLTSDRTLRMFGWLGKDAFIGQRVANDTAQALTEIEARYPPSP